jgi:hypothetical protein
MVLLGRSAKDAMGMEMVRPMRKTLWTLNIGNYAPELCELTYPLLLAYARKIGADFQIINERRFPEMPVTYEKLQIFYLGRGNDWNVYIDSDAVIFPDMFDVTERIPKNTVAHYGRDHCINRFKSNAYFRRDGRNIGSCNWFAVASDWCIDLWHPISSTSVTGRSIAVMHDDVSLTEALDAIRPIVIERQAGLTPDHLIDDYTLSLNIARYGLKFTTVLDIMREANDQAMYAWHTHRMPVQKKLEQIRQGLGPKGANLMGLDEFRVCKGFDLNAWLAEYGVDRSSRIPDAGLRPLSDADFQDMRTENELQPCDGIAPQDGEPCALVLGHAGPHSHVGPYRNAADRRNVRRSHA